MNDNNKEVEVNEANRAVEILPGVVLARYRSPNRVKLIAKRPAHDGSQSTVYEIDIDKVNGKAVGIRNEVELFKIECVNCGTAILERMAIKAMRAFCMEGRKANLRRRAQRKSKRAAAKAAKGEYFTPKSAFGEMLGNAMIQVEDLVSEVHKIENGGGND